MRSLVLAVLAVAGCGRDVEHDQPGTPAPFYLIDVTPGTVPLDGGQVTVTYGGDLPADATFIPTIFDGSGPAPATVTASPNPATHTVVLALGPAQAPSVVSIDVDYGGLTEHWRNLVSYEPGPPIASMTATAETNMAAPLHPELARPCARAARFGLTDNEAGNIRVTGSMVDDPAFSVPAACQPYPNTPQGCWLEVCFDSTVPGDHDATFELTTNEGTLSAALHATVTAPITDLDPTVGAVVVDTQGPGWNNLDADYLGGAAATGTGLLLFSRWNVLGVDGAGTEADQAITGSQDGTVLDWIRAMRTTANGDVYAILGDVNGGSVSAIAHFNADGTRDVAFDLVALPFYDPGYYRGIELQAGGRLLAIGSQEVVGIKNGAVDASYADGGFAQLPSEFFGVSVIDAQGRLYASLADRVLRLTPDGAADPTYVQGPASSLAIDSTGQVVSGGQDLTFDAAGRRYDTNNGVVQRYAADGTFDRTLGFGSARGVRCPPIGTCWLFGVEGLSPPTYGAQIYAARLAD